MEDKLLDPENVRRQLKKLKDSAQQRVWAYGAQLGLGEGEIEPLANALGDISVEEALAAMDRAAIEMVRKRLEAARPSSRPVSGVKARRKR